MSRGENAPPMSEELENPALEIQLPPRDYRRFPGSAYGDQLVAARYCGLSAPPHNIDGEWQHGWQCPERNIHPEFVVGGDGKSRSRRAKSRFFVARQDQAEYLGSAGYARVQPVGLPIVYVPRPAVRRIARSLLVLPVHSLPEMTEDWDAGAYAAYVQSIAPRFSRVCVSLHQASIDKGTWTAPFKAAGMPIIGGADEADQGSLERMALLFSQFEFVTSNGFGSHVAYASYLGCKVSVSGPRPQWRRSDYAGLVYYRNAPELLDIMEEWARTDRLARLYPQFVRDPWEAHPQQAWAAWQLGEQCKRSPEELKKLFGWDLAGRVRSRAHACAAIAGGLHRLARRGWLLLASIGLPGLVAAVQITTAERKKQGVSRVWCGWRRRLALRNGSSDLEVFEQHFARREVLDIPLPATVSTVVDLGANVGISVEVFRRMFPRARIVAVELERRNAELCKVNHASDPLVTVVNAAVWSRAGTVGVRDVADGEWAYRVRPLPAGSETAGIPAVTYPQLLAMHGLDRVDVVKMDIEGAEADVLEASSAEIFRTTAVCIIEIHDWIEGVEARVRKVIDGARRQFDLDVSRRGEFCVIRNKALLPG